MYYDARYYDPDLGRFLQPDPMLDGMNRYTYCGNNPIRYSDPTGFSYIGDEGVYVVEPGDNGFDDDPYGDNENDNKKKNDEKKKANNPPVVDDDGNVSATGGASNEGITAGDVGNFLKDVGIGLGKQYGEDWIAGQKGLLKMKLMIMVPGFAQVCFAKDAYDLYKDFDASGAKSIGEYIGTKVKETIANTAQYVKENPGEATGRGLLLALEMIIAGKMAKAPKVNGGGAVSGMKQLPTPRQALMNNIQNPKLKNLVDQMYRPGARTGSGSTADMLRAERAVGGFARHQQKVVDMRRAVNKIRRSQRLQGNDIFFADWLYNDLNNAFMGK